MYFRFFLVSAASIGGLIFSMAAAKAQGQTPPLTLRASLVLTPEFCGTQFKKGDWASGKENFSVGKAACLELEPALKTAFSNLAVSASVPSSGDSAIVLVPRFVDAGATKTLGAFSKREMDVFLEWTIKDPSGKILWFETVQGSAKHHSGNMFTYKKSLKAIVEDSVKDVAIQSASRMCAAPELRKLSR